MFKVVGKEIRITRGDKGTMGISLKDYTFQPNDVLAFRVYEKEGLHKPPVMEVITNVEEEAKIVDIFLPSEKTKIGEIVNEEVEYWYEIELNGEQTPYCYDEDGPKIFMLYPEGADSNATSQELVNR